MKSQGYGMDERPPVRELVPFGVQHALLVAFQALPAPLLVSAGLGFSPAETTVLVACALFVAGVSTLVQTLGIGPVGGKLPIAMVCSIVFVSPALLIAPQAGYAGYVGACLVGSLVCGVVFFAFSDRLKVVVPSFVSGAVVFVLGTTLLGVALGYCAGGADSPGFGDPANYLLAGITLATVLAFNVLGKGFLHGAAPLIGLAVGFATAAALGRVDFGPVEAAAWFAFPEPLHWGTRRPRPCSPRSACPPRGRRAALSLPRLSRAGSPRFSTTDPPYRPARMWACSASPASSVAMWLPWPAPL